jgi:hypothetical protein
VEEKNLHALVYARLTAYKYHMPGEVVSIASRVKKFEGTGSDRNAADELSHWAWVVYREGE